MVAFRLWTKYVLIEYLARFSFLWWLIRVLFVVLKLEKL